MQRRWEALGRRRCAVSGCEKIGATLQSRLTGNLMPLVVFIFKMLALEIHINRQKKLIAGMADGGVVTALLACTFRPHAEQNLPREETFLHVSGLDSKRHEYGDWLKSGLAV